MVLEELVLENFNPNKLASWAKAKQDMKAWHGGIVREDMPGTLLEMRL